MKASPSCFQVPAVKDHKTGLVLAQTTTAAKFLAKKLKGGAYDVAGSVEEEAVANKVSPPSPLVPLPTEF